MREKKTLKEYRAHGVKLPALAWVLDRHLVYTSAAIVGVIAISGVSKTGWDSYQKAIAEPEVISPYIEIEPVSSVSRTWASSFIKIKPKTVKKWAVSENSKAQPILDREICDKTLDITSNLLSTHIATGSGIETRVQVYGAGQSAKQYEDYVEKLKTCFVTVDEDTQSSTKIAQFSNGFILNVGDSIISVTSNKSEQIPELLKFYIQQAEKTLLDSQCLSLNSSPEDVKRSFYYNEKTYEGLKDSKNIATNVDFSNLSTPTSIKLNNIKLPGSIIPESPLPKDFPKLPESVEVPDVPHGVKVVKDFKDTATYLVADTDGPGCGWAWSAQVSPVYDLKKLGEDKKAEISNIQNYVDRKAEDYVGENNSWAANVLAIMPNVDNWNLYVKDTNNVHKKWSWLKIERNKIQSSWYNYVTAHDSWLTFDSRKATALEEYNKEAQRCEITSTQIDEWEDEWGDIYKLREEARKKKAKEKAKEDAKKDKERRNSENKTTPSSPSPSEIPTASAASSEMPINPQMPYPAAPIPPESPAPTAPTAPSETQEPTAPSIDTDMEIPPRPIECTTPVRPSIIDQDKPAEPMAPSIPDGVTIPESWPKPQK